MTQSTLVVGDVGAGHVLGRYELLMPIASGGMAMVWAARLKGTRGFQKIVAVKTILPKLSEDAHFEQMFLDEASLASQIRHPHVVEILDLGEQEGVLYLVMEWIDGVPVHQLMKSAKNKGGVPLPVAVRIVMQACAGLHAAHELRDPNGQLVGLVHRDVSPQNILVTFDGVAKVVDFGVAKATALGEGSTAAGQVKGKVSYMAPEQVRGQTIDRRVDVFAMGIVLYALTTGKHPFRKETEAGTMYNIASPQPVVPPRNVVPGFPAPLERVLLQALAKDPAKRFPTCNDLLRALDQALPASMRASTDEDIAAFVRGLLGDKRDERREALAQALQRADQQASVRVSLRQVLDSQRPPPLGDSTGSGRHAAFESGSSSMLTPSGAKTKPPELVAAVQGGTLGSGFASDAKAKRRKLVVASLAGGVLVMLIAVGIAIATAKRDDAQTALGATPEPAPAKSAAATTAQPAAAPAPEVVPMEPDTVATASASAATPEPTPTPATAARPSAPRPRPQTSATPRPPKPAGGSWKHDPGF